MAIRARRRQHVHRSRLDRLSLGRSIERVAVLLTEAEGRGALAACRGLHGAGFLVAAAAAERPALTHWSRCCAERLFTANPRSNVRSFLEDVENAVATGGYGILLPGSEASLVAVSESRDALEQHVDLGLPPHEVVERCIDKVALLEEAEAAGLPAPVSVLCTSDSVAAAAGELGFPVVLKSRTSFVRRGDRLMQSPTIVASDQGMLAQALPRFAGPLVVQRFEGRPRILSCSGVVAGGKLRAVALARYERTWPVAAGPSSFAETVSPSGDLLERVETLLQRFGWQGIFQVQLLERSNGTYAALDLNPRIFGSLALPIAAGANLPAVWCGWLLGRESPLVVARAGVRYRWEGGDLRHGLRRLHRGQLSSAASAARPRRRVAHALFKLGDPAPLAAATVSFVWRRRKP